MIVSAHTQPEPTMTNQQTYTSRSNAKRAALADLGKDAVEGRDYQITKHQNGRFAYQRAVGATKPDKCAKVDSGTRPPTKAKRPVSHHDRRDKYGLRLGTKRAQAAAMFEAGCTMANVRKATGSAQYNLLKKLAGDGHCVVHNGNTIKREVKEA